MLQANKVLMLARSNKKKLSNLQKRTQPDESLKGSVFGKRDLLSFGHNVDLELTLPTFWDLYHGHCLNS